MADETPKLPDDCAMTDREWRDANFREAVRRLPPPIPMFDDAVPCPWCGAAHEAINIGKNSCLECDRFFLFGFPPFETSDERRPVAWVDFPWREFDELGDKAHLLEKWEPNERLKEIYKFWAERRADAADEEPKPAKLH